MNSKHSLSNGIGNFTLATIISVTALTSSMPASLAKATVSKEIEQKPISTVEKKIAAQLLHRWNCSDAIAPISEKLTFKISKDGYAYDLSVKQGFIDPSVIKASIHAVLSATPFTDSTGQLAGKLATCSIEGPTEHPVITISLSELPANESDRSRKMLSEAPFSNKTSQYDSIIRSWMIDRLIYLCNCFFEFPDSTDTTNEVAKSFSQIGLDSKSAHDWISLGRATQCEITIARNPDKQIADACNLAACANFQAYRLRQDSPTLFALEKAYASKAAYEVLAASKADLVMLGTAAALSDQYSQAHELYKAADKRGNKMAKLLLYQWYAIAFSKSKVPIAPNLLPTGKIDDWNKILYWLPVDTETVSIAQGPFTIKEMVESTCPDRSRLRAQDILKSMALTIQDYGSEEAKTILDSSKIAVALTSGRAFRPPSGLGAGSSQGACIVVFSNENSESAQRYIEALKKSGQCTKMVNGLDTIVFHKPSAQFDGGYLSYVFSPANGVIVSASSEQYLYEMVERMKKAPGDRALPASLKEWQSLDQSKYFAIRHYDKSFSPFDLSTKVPTATTSIKQEDKDNIGSMVDKGEIGITITSPENDKIRVKMLSETPGVLVQRVKTWCTVLSGNRHRTAAPSHEAACPDVKVTYEKNAATLDINVTESNVSMLSLLILQALGTTVFI